MKNLIRSIIILCLAISGIASAAAPVVQVGPTVELKITLDNMQTYGDYKDVADGLSKISGVTNLIPYKIASGKAVFDAKYTGESSSLFNDVQAFATDRYKFEKKESKTSIEVTLRKL